MKILFFSDPHNSDTPPRMRRDNYTESILKKQEELILVAKNCDMVVIGGDIFHKKDPTKVSFKLVHRVMEIYRQYPNVHIILGNHDYMSRVKDSLENHFGMLEHLPNVKIYRDEHVWQEEGIRFNMIPYQETIDAFLESFTRNAWNNISGFQKEGVKHSICFTHAPISPSLLPFDHISVDRVKGCFSYLFSGHFHSVQHWSDRFGNPGALSRGVLTLDGTIDRPVGAFIIDVSGQISTTFCQVSHAPAEEVFKVEDAMEKRELSVAISEFVSHITDFQVPIALSREDLLYQIEQLPIEEPVKIKAKFILERT